MPTCNRTTFHPVFVCSQCDAKYCCLPHCSSKTWNERWKPAYVCPHCSGPQCFKCHRPHFEAKVAFLCYTCCHYYRDKCPAKI